MACSLRLTASTASVERETILTSRGCGPLRAALWYMEQPTGIGTEVEGTFFTIFVDGKEFHLGGCP